MVPFEVLLGSLWMVFGFVGLSRKFPRELGATMGFAAMLFMFELGGPRLTGLGFRAATAAGVSAGEDLVRWASYTALIAMWVFFMYAGQTLTYPGKWPPGPVVGTLLDLAVGLFNGWLVLGTWWHHTHRLGYPLSEIGLFTPPLSDRAQALVGLTPQALVPDGQATWWFGAFLLFLFVLRVAR